MGLVLWLGFQDQLADVAHFMDGESLLVGVAFPQVNFLAAYPARKGLGSHATPLTQRNRCRDRHLELGFCATKVPCSQDPRRRGQEMSADPARTLSLPTVDVR